MSLIRPLVETLIRADLAIMGTEEELAKLKHDDYRTNFGMIGKEIDTFFNTDDCFDNFLKQATPILHSYTHVGIMQLANRFSGTDLAPNYSEAQILEGIRIGAGGVFIVNNLITKFFRFEEEWKEKLRLFRGWESTS